MFCEKCGKMNDDNSNFCMECGATLIKQENVGVLENPVPKKGKKIILIILIIVAAISLVVATYAVLISNHIICLEHEWLEPTCTEPETCEYCDKTEGEALGHKWEDATCEEPQKCSVCEETKGEALGHKWNDATCTKAKNCSVCDKTEGKPLDHTKGQWVTTKKATLTSYGSEEVACIKCNKTIDTRSISKKDAAVSGSSFNFTDSELIDWINYISTAHVSSVELGVAEAGSDNTSYVVTTKDGETGIMMLNHGKNGKNGNICAIMFYFDEYTTSLAFVSFLGEEIDSGFDSEDAIEYLILSNNVYSEKGMSVAKLKLDSSTTVAFIAPTGYVNELID